MYLGFYGLERPPFGPTPDPSFLYLTPDHQEALAQLLYGVQERKGFIVLTGEVGTGKTTLLHALRHRLDADTAVAFVFDSSLSFEGLLEYVLEEFGVGKDAQTEAQRLIALNTFLIERRRAGLNTVLILDEAQNLEPRTLERIRLLSNFETASEKLLQIVLAGQPELRDRLDLPALRQLKQRIGLRCRIRPLTRDETRDYIRTRLRMAGTRSAAIFTDRAVARIARYARGVPRVINIVCDHCLALGYGEQRRRIDRNLVDEAIDYFESEERSGLGRRLRRLARPVVWGALVGAAALAGMAAVAWHWRLVLP